MKEKKSPNYLYIDADEDHVSLQFIDKKGDIRKLRANTIMPKLVYVYEGITNENGRNELVNKSTSEACMKEENGIDKKRTEAAE